MNNSQSASEENEQTGEDEENSWSQKSSSTQSDNIYDSDFFNGLPNLGNTCFANSVFQLLFNLNSFARRLILNREKIVENGNGTIAFSLYKLFQLKSIMSKQFPCINNVIITVSK